MRRDTRSRGTGKLQAGQGSRCPRPRWAAPGAVPARAGRALLKGSGAAGAGGGSGRSAAGAGGAAKSGAAGGC